MRVVRDTIEWLASQYKIKIGADSLDVTKGGLTYSLLYDQGYLSKTTTESLPVTGTLSEVEVLKITIPANSFSSEDVLTINNLMIQKVGVGGTAKIRVKLSTSSTMPSGATDQIAVLTTANTSLYSKMVRSFVVSGGYIKGLSFTYDFNTDLVNSTSAMGSKVFNTTVVNYLYVSLALTDITDNVYLESLLLKNN